MNRIAYILFSILLAVSCGKTLEPLGVESLRIDGIRTTLVNGEAASKSVDPLTDSVGRTSFRAGDVMHFTSICRTANPIGVFSYSGIDYQFSENKSWGKQGDQDIYWSDAVSDHTFIAYSLPVVASPMVFDWTFDSGHYYGSVGALDGEGLLVFDYDPVPDPDPAPTTPPTTKADTYEHTTLRSEDLLLTYETELKHTDAVAYVNVHHALSSMRVTVQISGFSTSETDNDHQATVKDLVVKDQPVKYSWAQDSYRAAALSDSQGQTYRDMKLCIPNPSGKKPSKTDNSFVFYGITAPHTETTEISFTVRYPNPMPMDTQTPPADEWKEQTYHAILSNVRFDAGYCTSIIIKLNHQNEDITVGASYNDWIYVDTPDIGDLDKIQVFLKETGRTKVTVHSDTKATLDDATWLYVDEHGAIKDIYGHTGEETDPYLIKNANQFLSFAYEVNESNNGAGWDFARKYITLDSGLILQPNNTKSEVIWPGIGIKTTPGVNSSTDRPFNGHLMGGVRLIKRLKGKPLFGYIGPTGHVDQLLLEDVLDIDGAAAYATQNDGIICAGKVASVVGESFSLKETISISNIKLDETDNFTNITWGDSGKDYEHGTTTVAAPFVAYNNGVILACYCVGDIKMRADRNSGIVGYNNGAMVVDYSAVKASALPADTDGSSDSAVLDLPFYRGTVAYNCYHPDFFISHHKPHPEQIAYQTVNFNHKAIRIFDEEDTYHSRTVSFTVTGIKEEGKEIHHCEWGDPTGSSVEKVSVSVDGKTITVRSKQGERGETFFPVKVYYSETEYVEDYVRAMAAEPLNDPKRLEGDYAGTLTHCFFDYQVSGVDPTLAIGQVYGYSTAQMQSRSFIGSPDPSNKDRSTLNGSIHYFADENNAKLIPASMMEGYKLRYGPDDTSVSNALKQLSAHCMSRYYVFHAASYPWVY